ncbi:hypothetical protein BTA30_09040 [Bacillus swezeyi]|uniref:Uncharacterized protein n=1 Tax=Bacillus swezeyi TaxID=1925020 RepID=A0A1R1Q9C0_9BACI|nr:hypothetical protein BW143_20695 [Bacillus swezeyi]OMI31724.1 hypothetical protein BTA30_09040 [Bacillus swezeyi]
MFRQLQIVDKILKRFKVLGFCHPFSVIENLCSLGRASIGAERMLEFVSTDAQGLTTNARVCRHAGAAGCSGSFFYGPNGLSYSIRFAVCHAVFSPRSRFTM